VLLIALRVLCLLELSARQQLQVEGEKLEEIYPGNPNIVSNLQEMRKSG
jgi:hypothetical protein